MRRTLALLVAVALLSGVSPAAAGVLEGPEEAPRYYPEFTYERVRVEMRDGVELSVDIWRPVTPKDVKVPVILQLTPYHVLYGALDPNWTDLPSGDARLLVPKGYAYAIGDVRGTYNSGGCWDYGGLKERHDGYDLVEWLGTRPWSNGRVAMTGASYDGTTANAAAVERPPHLATIVPISAISRWWGYAYQQGTRATYSGESADADPPGVTPPDFMFGYGFLPPPDPAALTSAQQISMRWDLCGRDEKLERAYLNPDYDKFWMERDYLHLAHRVNVPVVVTHGQLDFNVKTWEGTAWFEALDTEKVLVMGQWPHASPRGRYPDWDIFIERWYERWLYGTRNGIEKEPSVRIQTNDNEWHMSDRYSRDGKDDLITGYSLDGPKEFTYFDDGALTESEMLRGIGEGTRFIRVPLDGTKGESFEGRPQLSLRAKSDSTATNFVAVLLDCPEAGSCRVITRAFLDARYRDGLRKAKALQPDKWYDLTLEFIDKSYVVPDGNHLELLIGSSSSTWVAPAQQRANNTLSLQDSFLWLP